MSSNIVLLINALAYTGVSVYWFYKNRLSLGLLIWVIYNISAWASFFFIQQPLYNTSMHVSKQTLFPCFYLFALLFLCIYPLIKIKRIDTIVINNWGALKVIICICIIFQLVFIIVDLPAVYNVLSSNSQLADLRQAAYGREGEKSLSIVTKIAFTNRMSLLYTGMRPLATGLSVFLLFCSRGKNLLFKMFAVTTFLENIQTIIVTVGRGQMIITLMIYALSFFLIWGHLKNNVKRKVFFYAIPILIIGIVFFWAITISRFGDDAIFYMYKYLGESMNNFNGILFNKIRGNTEGQAYFSYVYRYIGGEDTFATAQGKYMLIEKITGVTPFIFYTYIGGLIIEFGKIIPIIVVLFINRFSSKLKQKNILTLDRAMLYVFFIYFYIYGLFSFPIQNFTGFIIIYLFMFYSLFGEKRNL